VPVVVVNGVFDRCIPIERARRTATRVFGQPPAEFQEGHFPFLTHVPLVADALDRLATGHERAWQPAYALRARSVASGGNLQDGRSQDA